MKMRPCRNSRSSTKTISPVLRTWALVSALALVMPVILAACLSNFDTPGPLTCDVDEDCPADMGCAGEVGLCFYRCEEATTCPTLAYRCEGGLCLPVVGADCEEHGDCGSPAGCETADNASCVEGKCMYHPVVCDTPPLKECLQNDTVIRVWMEVGICTITPAGPIQGECEYDYTDVPCPSCQANCLEQDPCEDVICPDENGGCLIHGVCLPTTPTTCQYADAPVNTICDRPGSAAGAQDGYCDAGICGAEVPIPCTDNTECDPQTCIANFCRVVAGFEGICDAGDDADCGAGLECSGEVCLRTEGETCQSNGECASTCIGLVCAPPSAENGPCDSAGDGDDDDCQAALNCNSGVCETGIACSDNGVCNSGDVCISGYCRAPAATGGTCDSGQDGDCLAGHTCVSGVCLLNNGQACGSNSQCQNVCIASVCDDLGATRQPCDTADGAADCQTGRTCTSGLCLLLDGQGGCTDDNQCVSTCIAGTCGPRVGTGSTCDSAGDCLAGHTCTGGECLLNNGQSCTTNSQCVHVCLGGLCGGTSGTLGPCDVADGDADCQAGLDCVGGVCLLPNGQSCTANAQCVTTCISLTCASLAGTSQTCDTADGDADCQTGHDCVGGVCLLDNGQSCTADSQCVNTCISLACAPLSGAGEDCDNANDCQSGLVCVGLQCTENGIARIRVQGTGVSGGGNSLSGWYQVDAAGANLGSVSPSGSQPLYRVIDWTVDLNTVLVGNDYFALVGNESSADLTRTFTFYDTFDAQIDQVVVPSVDSGWIVRNFSDSDDFWVRFHFDGSQVTWTPFTKPITRITVTGTATSSGGGNGLSGFYRVSSGGHDLGQLSPGTSQTLYQVSNWDVNLTTDIEDGFEFALVGNEGSAAITRTFTFKDSGGNTIDTVVISDMDSLTIVRLDNWNSGDTYIHFEYNNGVVSSSSAVSQ